MKIQKQILSVTKINEEKMVVKAETKTLVDAFQMLTYLVRAVAKGFNKEPKEFAEILKDAMDFANGKEIILLDKKGEKK